MRSGAAAIGTVVDRYRIEAVLGAGGFGTVYRARHTVLDTAVALKVLSPDHANDPVTVERLLQEAKAAASLGHPNIVAVHDAGRTADGTPFLAMELLSGSDLAAMMGGSGPMPIDLSLAIAVQILSALGAVHDRGIVHRDLKPENVFLCDTRDGPLVKLLDFGISKVTIPEAVRSLTETGTVLGTPEYMAPEQLMGAKGIDGRADLYSLCIMLYEMLSGFSPSQADSPHEHPVRRLARL